MNYKRAFTTAFITLGALLACTSAGAAKKAAKPIAGTKVASGEFFDIYVQKKEEKPGWAGTDLSLGIYQSVIVARTVRHGTQRFISRVEGINVDLLDPKNWEIADLNNDGVQDYRVVTEVTKGGCQTSVARLWQIERERFTNGGPELIRSVDNKGKPVKNCIGQ